MTELAFRAELSGFAPPAEPEARTRATALARDLHANLGKILLGTEEAVTVAVIAALSGGHLLIEDVPGVGKTVLAQSIAISLGVDLSRIQGHPDLLPSDVTGVTVYSGESSSWEFRPGPVFCHVVLVDELNRTPPRTQSALLETMEEHQVSVDGKTWPLPEPHFVIATQNPVGQLGTFPLVESQLDRFALSIAIGYPSAATEAQLALGQGGREALSDLSAICDAAQWRDAIAATRAVHVAIPVAEYAVSICRATRIAPGVRLGASPRASITVVRSAQARALLDGRHYVSPDDVRAVAVPTLAHRLVTDGDLRVGASVVVAALSSVAAPRP
jgi:MoxR-like ATPase